MKLASRTVLLAAFLLALSVTTSVRAQVRELQVAPATVELLMGQREGVLATAFDANGNVLPDADLTWTSTNVSVVRVERDDVLPNLAYLIGMSPGIASVNVRAGSTVATATVSVGGGDMVGRVGGDPATVLRLEPSTMFLLPTEETRLRPVFLTDDGSPAAPTPLSWQSLLLSVATVDNQGHVVGIAPGQGVIEVRTPTGLVARTPVIIQNAVFAFSEQVVSLAPAASETLTVVVPSQGNRRVANRQLRWTSSDVSVAAVSPAGEVTGIGPGRALVVVSGFGQTNRVPVVVHRPVEYLVASPPTRSEVGIPIGSFTEFTVQLEDASQQPVPEAPIIWEVEDSTVVTFDSTTRRATGRRSGTTRLTVRGPGSGLETTWTLRVFVGGVDIEPDRLGIGGNDQLTLQASYTDQDGVVVGEASGATWRSLNPQVATVDENGLVRGQSWGYGRIVAAAPGGVADTSDVYVQGQLLVTSTRAGSADIYALDPDSASILNRLTSGAGAEVAASYSPDGSRIAYISTEQGAPQISIMNADGSDQQPLGTPISAANSPMWSPDGSQIVYVLMEGSATDIWAVNIDGGDPIQITSGGSIIDQPAPSPDGRTIAYRSTQGGNRDIYLVNSDGGDPRALTSTETGESNPRWFPDGRLGYVAERRIDRRTTNVVVRTDPSTGESEVITPLGLTVIDFAVSGDGQLLALIVNAPNERGTLVSKLYLLPLAGPQAGIPVEVPRSTLLEQFLAPSFRW